MINAVKIPKYYYVHPITLSNSQVQSLKNRAGIHGINIQVLELHFDGHNGDHLLVYSEIGEEVYLVAIGTHSDLFRK
ncbi:hypothetical protein LBO01_14170 [Companilactobacillus paralimentarius]|uniref:Replication associated protein n=1 Tax=Companilactobacillus bobalius TaxID=2801451 RepID=A0A202FA30_9LACO|nr:hypothetical protein ATN92_00970 [Companilactobacillus bobalius]OVE97325.1 hypothetical protein LKACC16343_01815 [Companilactobacillus bobalius]GEO58288.1 hypothetical protein LBO01_14170 [Companilactobacillus paralimentarius]